MNMAEISAVLKEKNCDAYVIYDTSDNEDMRYLSGFLATDPFIYVYKKKWRRVFDRFFDGRTPCAP